MNVLVHINSNSTIRYPNKTCDWAFLSFFSDFTIFYHYLKAFACILLLTSEDSQFWHFLLQTFHSVFFLSFPLCNLDQVRGSTFLLLFVTTYRGDWNSFTEGDEIFRLIDRARPVSLWCDLTVTMLSSVWSGDNSSLILKTNNAKDCQEDGVH